MCIYRARFQYMSSDPSTIIGSLHHVLLPPSHLSKQLAQVCVSVTIYTDPKHEVLWEQPMALGRTPSCLNRSKEGSAKSHRVELPISSRGLMRSVEHQYERQIEGSNALHLRPRDPRATCLIM